MVGGGAVAVLVILLGMKIVVPAAGRWQSREDAIAAKAGELARLEALIADSAALGQRAEALRRARAERRGALLEGGTSALAGSTLQSLIRGYGEDSRVLIQRLDPVRPGGTGALVPGADREHQPAAAGAGNGSDLTPVGLSLSGRGDIYGLVDFLGRLQNGGPLLVVDELRVSTPGGRSADELLNWTVRVTGFFMEGEGAI